MIGKRLSRSALSGLALAAFSVVTALAVDASAQENVLGGDWRQSARARRSEAYRSPQRFAVELRFGGYYPQVDDEFGGDGPYHKVFGGGPQFYFGLEVDWQALRIPFVGVIGPGLGWGYTSRGTKALVSGTDTESGEDTSLTIMPWHLSAVLRVDELYRRTGIPVVPYAKFGLAFATWSAATTDGVSTFEGVKGQGTTWGEHLALGGMLALNFLDPQSAADMDENAGVNHAYVFGEWMDMRLDGIGSRPQMHVGSSSWVVGLAADF